MLFAIFNLRIPEKPIDHHFFEEVWGAQEKFVRHVYEGMHMANPAKARAELSLAIRALIRRGVIIDIFERVILDSACTSQQIYGFLWIMLEFPEWKPVELDMVMLLLAHHRPNIHQEMIQDIKSLSHIYRSAKTNVA